MMLGPGADSYKTCLPGHQQQHDDPHEHQDDQDDHVPDQGHHVLGHHQQYADPVGLREKKIIYIWKHVFKENLKI